MQLGPNILPLIHHHRQGYRQHQLSAGHKALQHLEKITQTKAEQQARINNLMAQSPNTALGEHTSPTRLNRTDNSHGYVLDEEAANPRDEMGDLEHNKAKLCNTKYIELPTLLLKWKKS
ncbi:hypothetical protein Bca4012_009942 [Brassica carinata]